MKKLMSIILAIVVLLSSTTVFASQSEETKLSTPQFISITRKAYGDTVVKWMATDDCSGYEIQYSTKKDYTNAKLIRIKKASQETKRIKDLSKSKPTYIRLRSYKLVNQGKRYSEWNSGAKLIVWNSKYKYAKNSKIHSDCAVLLYSNAKNKKNITVAVNAGHGCKGGELKKTLCHPDGTPKVTGGSTAKGSKYAQCISNGSQLKNMDEGEATLIIAIKLKETLLKNGYNVLMLRQNADSQLDNIARTVVASNNANCLISIHFDSSKTDKGAYFASVPDVKSYRKMQPVKSNYKQHDKLGKAVINGLRKNKVKIFSQGYAQIDLTQTSYSTIPSTLVEVGDKATSTSNANLSKIAKGLAIGIDKYYK